MKKISGYILIHKSYSNSVSVQSNSDFFAQELTVKVDDDKITFKSATLEDKKSRKPRLNKGNWYQLSIVANKQDGKYDFDEESTIDEVIVYCK